MWHVVIGYQDKKRLAFKYNLGLLCTREHAGINLLLYQLYARTSIFIPTHMYGLKIELNNKLKKHFMQ